MKIKQTTSELLELAAKNLPTHMMPFLIATGTQLPMTTNNKVDKVQLKALILDDTNQRPVLSLKQLWKRYTCHDPHMHSNFITDGGDSFSAVLIAETLDCSELVDILLRKSFQDASDFIKMIPNKTLNSTLDSLRANGNTGDFL